MGLAGPLRKFSLSFLHKCIIQILFNSTINIERFAITVILIVFIIQVPLIYCYLTSNASTLQSANCQFSTTSIAFAKLHIFIKRSLLVGTKRLCNTFCLRQKSWKKIEQNPPSSCYKRRLIIFSAKFKVLYLRNFNDM